VHIIHVEYQLHLVATACFGAGIDPGDKFMLSGFQEQENLISHQLCDINLGIHRLGNNAARRKFGIDDIFRANAENNWFSSIILEG